MNELDLFAAVIAIADPTERAALLERECAGRGDLRLRLDQLLEEHFRANSFLDPPFSPNTQDHFALGVETSDHTSRYEQAGVVIGDKYTLVEPIGQGGMGSVWRARQTEPVKRFVAVKVIKAGMDTRQVLARFDAERQALAMMDHPNIAKVLDAGTTDGGRPYFVMELVKGLPITDYCDKCKLTPRQRLDLFVPVCQAIQHAHQKGIIHRDIKPSNVLVAMYDDRPVPKVIDFGVAKATGGSLTDRTFDTGISSVVGTPQYMSPEQATFNNLDIDTRSDVYSLGVLLYELLTGSPPFAQKELQKAGLMEILRVVREEEPPRPSTKLSSAEALPSLSASRGTEPKKLTGLLRNELDWIVMKALEKDRTRRYETANGFAADVTRYLTGEAVHAHPPSTAYRLKKFVRRYRGQVIAASLVFFALLAGIIGTTLGLFEAKRQAGIAEVSEKKAVAEKQRAVEFRNKALDALRATTSTDVELLIGGKPELGANERAYLEAIAKRWQAFASQEGADEQARSIRGEGHYAVAVLWQKLGRPEEARPEHEKGLEIQEQLVADFPTVPGYRSSVAKSHNNLGSLLADLGMHAAAQEHIEKAIVIWQNLVTEFATSAEYRRYLATSQSTLGSLLTHLGKRTEALEQYKKAIEIQEKLAVEFSTVPEYRDDLAMTQRAIGFELSEMGKESEALEYCSQAILIQERLVSEFPNVPQYRVQLAGSYNNLGIHLKKLYKGTEALEQYNKFAAIQEKLVLDFPAVPSYRSSLAAMHNNLGNLLGELGKRAEALEHFKKSLAIQENLSSEFPTVLDYRNSLAGSHNNIGLLFVGIGQVAEGLENYNKAISLREKLASDYHNVPTYRAELARIHANFGNLLKDLGKRAETEEQYKLGIAITEKLVADFPELTYYQTDLGAQYFHLGNTIRDWGRVEESLNWFEKAIEALLPVHLAEPLNVSAKQNLRASYQGRAMAYDQLNRFSDAVKDWDRAVEFSMPHEKSSNRVSKAKAQIQAGMVTQALAEVLELTKSSQLDAEQWYDFARIYIFAGSKDADKKQEYNDRAVEMLQQAAKSLYANNDAKIKKRQANHALRDPELDPLRERDDVKQLMVELKELIAELDKKAEQK